MNVWIKIFAYSVLSCSILTGCVTSSEFLPDDYKGATAILADSSKNFIGASLFVPAKVDFFIARKIDNKIIDNALVDTRVRYSGLGHSFTPKSRQRRIPAKSITVELLGTTYHGADIGALFGTTYSVSRTVKFRPQPGRRYVVRGKLSKGNSSVWIQTAGGRVVGRTVVAKK